MTVNDVMVRTQVTRVPAEIDTLATDWRSAMLKDGWRDSLSVPDDRPGS